jgi:hypothetical protein
MLELTVNAQRNVWRDDSAAVLKADTSLVKINERYYQKKITVTYKEVTEANFDEKIEELKNRKEDLRLRFDGEQERYRNEIDVINEQLEAERIFVQSAKKEMRWLDREEKEVLNPKQNENGFQDERREEFFKSKKPREKN